MEVYRIVYHHLHIEPSISQFKACCVAISLAGRFRKPRKWTESNYAVTAVDFASCYCVSRGTAQIPAPNWRRMHDLCESHYNEPFAS